MGSPYLGEIRIFAGNFAPRGWAFCNGQILAINQNQALFALVGTTYGGNGVNNFALPNLQSSVPMSQGQGPGLSPRVIGQALGSQNTSLNSENLPTHTHQLLASSAAGTTRTPSSSTALADVGRNQAIYNAGGSSVALNPAALGISGSSQPVSNLQPYLALSFIIALEGIFPSRN
jgi:microcystin-dependent protein